jgi:phosphotriesterase-related protein
VKHESTILFKEKTVRNVNSVLGPLKGEDLGTTLVHEHVVNSSGGIPQVFPRFVDRKATIAAAITQLKDALNEGVKTIVDVTPMDLGRDVNLLKEVSEISGIQIIPCTGTWLDIPRAFGTAPPSVIADIYIREIEEGIEGTGIKAGIIKVANASEYLSREEEIVLRGAAKANKATGVSITTHTNALVKNGEQQLRIFEDEGVDLSTVCIGHSNNTTDTEYLMGMAKRGAYIGMDHYPGGRSPGTPDWKERTLILVRLIEAGIEDHILLSHDNLVTVSHGPLGNETDRAQRLKYNPDGYSFINRKVLPMLHDLGVPKETIEKIMVENPRRFLIGN